MGESLVFGPFRLDTAGRQLWHGSEVVPLPPKALDLLQYLAEHQGELKTREELFAALWPGTIVDDHALSVQIREIRKALGDDVHRPTYVETRHRRGYCFRAEVQRTRTPRPRLLADASPPDTRYAHNGGVTLAYQVIGSGEFIVHLLLKYLKTGMVAFQIVADTDDLFVRSPS